ncbi:hypothetical protein ACWD5R_41090 [Streptomyces sp. NPDC002514]|uniref:hypothetical protein n=1 Tax=Streptomyces sp. NPDC001270 TaxID=3364554 RepID=UPI0036B37F52
MTASDGINLAQFGSNLVGLPTVVDLDALRITADAGTWNLGSQWFDDLTKAPDSTRPPLLRP